MSSLSLATPDDKRKENAFPETSCHKNAIFVFRLFLGKTPSRQLSPTKVSPTKKSPPKSTAKASPAVKVLKGPSAKSIKSLKSSDRSSSGSQEKKEAPEPTFTSFSENRESEKSVEGEAVSESQAKSIEGIDVVVK